MIEMDVAQEKIYLSLAEETSKMSPCFRSKCGAIIVKQGKVLSKGFNRSPINQPDCSKIGHCYRDEHDIKSGEQLEKCRAKGSHAEQNAITLAARTGGLGTENGVMFVYGNTEICDSCKAEIINAGIKMVIYKTKNDEIYHVNVEYDWSIHELDKKRRFEDWKKNARTLDDEEIDAILNGRMGPPPNLDLEKCKTCSLNKIMDKDQGVECGHIECYLDPAKPLHDSD